jgi:anti-anti-sigma factor
MGTVVVTVAGALDPEGSQHFRTVMRDLVENQGNLSVEVDLGRVTAIDATGLAALVEAATQAGERGGQLVLRNASGRLPVTNRRRPAPSHPPAPLRRFHGWVWPPAKEPPAPDVGPAASGSEGAQP